MTLRALYSHWFLCLLCKRISINEEGVNPPSISLFLDNRSSLFDYDIFTPGYLQVEIEENPVLSFPISSIINLE